MKKILVTGGAGFIGSNLLKSLVKLNHKLFSLDNYSTGQKKNEIDYVEYIEDDILNIGNLNNDFDLCFHLAAQSRVQPSFDKPEESLLVNVLGTSKGLIKLKLYTPVLPQNTIIHQTLHMLCTSTLEKRYANSIESLTK